MNKDKREKMVEKVRKLLALANNNPNENEAIASAIKAQEIMARFDIDEMELEDEVILEEITTNTVTVGKGLKWKAELAKVIAKNFRCKLYYSDDKQSMNFYGHKSDTKIAGDVFNYLFENGNRLARQYVALLRRRDCVTKGVYNSYVMGFVDGINDKLGKQCTALAIVIPEDVKEEYETFRAKNLKTCRYTLSTSRYNKGAYDSGKTEAKNLVDSNTLEG